MVFCSGVKGYIESVMGCEVARALQAKVVNYFKSCNWSEVHAWCFFSGTYRMLFVRALLNSLGPLEVTTLRVLSFHI